MAVSALSSRSTSLSSVYGARPMRRPPPARGRGPGGLVGVEGPGGRVHAAFGQLAVDIAGVVVGEGDQQGRGPPGRPRVQRHPGQRAQGPPPPARGAGPRAPRARPSTPRAAPAGRSPRPARGRRGSRPLRWFRPSARRAACRARTARARRRTTAPACPAAAAPAARAARRRRRSGGRGTCTASRRGGRRPSAATSTKACGARCTRVDVEPRPAGVHRLGDRRQVGPGADQVGGAGDGDQPGPAAELRRRATSRVQLAGVRVEVDPPHGGADGLGGDHPGPHVAVVVEPGHHDLVARPPVLGHGAGQVEGQRRS